MRTTSRILTVAVVMIVALAAPASANPAGPLCPECDGDAPANDDCAFSSADAGAYGENATVLSDADLCVGDADTHQEKGFWAVLSVCLDAFLGGIADALGIHAGADAYASQDGVDLDANVSAQGQSADFDQSPLGDLDGATWDTLGEANEQLRGAGVEPHGLVPVGGEALPPLPDEDACVDLGALAVC